MDTRGTTTSTFGSMLRAHRLGQGHTQSQVAARLGVNQSTYARWEGGRNQPNPDHLPVLAELLGTDVDDVAELLDRRDHDVTLDAVRTELEQLRAEVRALRALVGDRSGANGPSTD